MSPKELLGPSRALGPHGFVPSPYALASRVCSAASFWEPQARAQRDEPCLLAPEGCPYLRFSEPSQTSVFLQTLPLSFAELPGKDTKEQGK